MFWGRNVTTKSSPSRLIETCLRKRSALFRKASTTSSSDILHPTQYPRPSFFHGAEHGDCKANVAAGYNPAMGFNKRKMEDARRQEAEKEAAARCATNRQIFQEPTAWSPPGTSAIAGRDGGADGRREQHRHPPGLGSYGRCPACRPNAPFAELVCLSTSSVPRSITWSAPAIGGSASEWRPAYPVLIATQRSRKLPVSKL
jgi:hypothetical protein